MSPTHDILVFSHFKNKRNSKGKIYQSSGWGWCCSCGVSSLGHPDEDTADYDASFHEMVQELAQ